MTTERIGLAVMLTAGIMDPIPEVFVRSLGEANGAAFDGEQTGRLVRVDTATGSNCVVWTGEPLAAVVAVPGTSAVVLGTTLGNVLRVA